MEGPLLGFVLTDILGGLESSPPLGASDTDGDSLGISLPSPTDTSLGVIDGLLLCIELDNALGGIDSDGAFERICDGATKSLTSDDGNSLPITDGRVVIILGCSEGRSEAISDGTVLDDSKWLGCSDTKLLGLILELGTLDPMLLGIIVGNFDGITLS